MILLEKDKLYSDELSILSNEIEFFILNNTNLWNSKFSEITDLILLCNNQSFINYTNKIIDIINAIIQIPDLDN